MLRARGDGSARSQQTRLGNALSSQRDRVFDGRQIVKINPPTAHKGTTMYRLEPEVEAPLNTWGPWGPQGDLALEGPQTLKPFEPISSDEVGDLGDLWSNSYAQEKGIAYADTAQKKTRETYIEGNGHQVPKVPEVPIFDVSSSNETTSDLGTFGSEVPKESGKVPTATRVDLADLPPRPSR